MTVATLPLAPAALAEAFIVADVHQGDGIAVVRSDNHKCDRCWRHLPEVPESGGLCARCTRVVEGGMIAHA